MDLHNFSEAQLEVMIRRGAQLTPEQRVSLITHPDFEIFDAVIKEWIWKSISKVFREDLKKRVG